MGHLPYQLVQDFSHQQYDWKTNGFESEWLLSLDAIQKVPDASRKASQTLDATGSSLQKSPQKHATNLRFKVVDRNKGGVKGEDQKTSLGKRSKVTDDG